MRILHTKKLRQNLREMREIQCRFNKLRDRQGVVLALSPILLFITLLAYAGEFQRIPALAITALRIICAAGILVGAGIFYVIERRYLPRVRQAYMQPLQAYAAEMANLLRRSTGGRVRFWVLPSFVFAPFDSYTAKCIAAPVRFEVQHPGRIPEYYEVGDYYSYLVDPDGNGTSLKQQECIPIYGQIETSSGVVSDWVYFIPGWYENVSSQVEKTGLGKWQGADKRFAV